MQTVEIIQHIPLPKPYIVAIENDFYVNVYRDASGEFRYSSEEFSSDQKGLFNADQALEEAYRLTVLKTDWEYISTATSKSKVVTQEMRLRLNDLAKAVRVIREFGDLPQNYKIDEVEDAAAEILSGDRRHS